MIPTGSRKSTGYHSWNAACWRTAKLINEISLIRAASGCRTEHDLRVIEQRRRIDKVDLKVSVTMTRALPDAESVSGGR